MLNTPFQVGVLLCLYCVSLILAAPAPTRPAPLAALLSAAEQGQPGAANALQERIGNLNKDKMTPRGIAAVERTMAISGERQMREATQVGTRAGVDGNVVVDELLEGHDATLQVVMVEHGSVVAEEQSSGPTRRRNRPNIKFPKQLNFTGRGLPAPITPREEHIPVHVFNPKVDVSPSMPHTGTTKFFASIRRANDAIGRSMTSFRVQGGDEVDEGPTLFTPEPVSWVSLRHDEGRQQGYWSIPVDSLRVNGHYIDGAQGEAGIFDPSTYRLALSPLVAERVYDWVEGSIPIHAASARSSTVSYSYPCSAHISVSLEFAGREHTISTTKFRVTPLATEQAGEPACLGAVYGLKMLNDGPRAGQDEDLS